jgi:glycosyltransferase involved in cell wall biosynthesis
MSLTVLSVGYALAPVGPDAAGGAEQVLSALDHALARAGHASLVVAPAGSKTAGRLIATDALPARFTAAARRRIEALQRQCIAQALARFPVDLIHCHGLDFAEHLPETPVPTLVTLHLPAEFYPAAALARRRPWFNCVSAAQQARFPPLPRMLPPIDNGVPLGRLAARHARRSFVLALGRICPEKGFHLALDAAALAGVPLLLAGAVFPYAAHRHYLRTEIVPRLKGGARFLGPLDFVRKRRFLSSARCLLAPSLVAETSSLVAMEAIACGTPVVAFPAGALRDIVEPGVTGFLVGDVRAMAEAIQAAGRLDREACREAARRRFSQERMVARYLALYEQLTRTQCPFTPSARREGFHNEAVRQ